jgi:hypothetical protein
MGAHLLCGYMDYYADIERIKRPIGGSMAHNAPIRPTILASFYNLLMPFALADDV